MYIKIYKKWFFILSILLISVYLCSTKVYAIGFKGELSYIYTFT